MKKTALLLFVSSVFIFSGCSFFQKQEVPVAQPEEIKLEKKIGIVGSALDMQFTNPLSPYILVSESNETFYIDSVSVNLKKYGKRRVEVEGKWNDEKTVFNVETVTSLGLETQTKSSYQNPGLGIKFEYPSIWALNEEKNVVGLEKIVITPYLVDQSEIDSVDTITIERSENNKRLTPAKWLSLDDQFKSTNVADTAVYQGAKIGIAQSVAVKKISGPNEEDVEFFVARDTYMYHFSHFSMNDSDKDMYKNAFFNLVQSFEFIPFGKDATTLSPVIEPETISDPNVGSSSVKVSDPSPVVSPSTSKKTEEVKLPEKEVVTPVVPVVQTTSKDTFINYIKTNINSLAPEAPTSGTWVVSTIEFAYPEGQIDNLNAVYVVYKSGDEVRKLLLSIVDRLKPETMTKTAYFIPGDTQDWVLKDGTDTAKTNEKSVINVEKGDESVVKPGMTLLSANSFKIKIQYPSKWYWSQVSGGYGFSNIPVSSSNILIKLSNGGSFPDNMASIGDLNGRPASQGKSSDLNYICVQAKEKYCVSGGDDYVDTMKKMLETLVEL